MLVHGYADDAYAHGVRCLDGRCEGVLFGEDCLAADSEHAEGDVEG